MKTILLCCILFSKVFAGGLTTQPPELVFDNDFAFVGSEEKFELVNSTSEKLFFNAAESSCGCSSITFELKVIEPNSTITGIVKHKGALKRGPISTRLAIVFQNSEGKKYATQLVCSGTTKGLVNLSPESITIRELGVKMDLQIAERFPFGRIVSVQAADPNLEVLQGSNTLENGRSIIPLKLSYAGDIVLNPPPALIELIVTSEKQQEFQIKIPLISRLVSPIICINSPIILNRQKHMNGLIFKFLVSGSGASRVVGLKNVTISNKSLMSISTFEAGHDYFTVSLASIVDENFDQLETNMFFTFLPNEGQSIVAKAQVIAIP